VYSCCYATTAREHMRCLVNTMAITRLDKRVPAATDTQTTVEVLDYKNGNVAFYVVRDEIL
jgi:hypothetical protein